MTRPAAPSPLAGLAAPRPAAPLALCAESGAAPDWVQLTPGPELVGRDGRRWRLPDPGVVIEAHRQGGVDLPVDFEHATQLKGAAGEPAPAVGWIESLEARDGAIWGRVAWTEAGRSAVANRAYRYLSPVLSVRDGVVVRIVSAGLTNAPNLQLQALNREDGDQMDDLKRVAKAAGLPETAGPAEIELAICAMRDRPDLTRFAPRADLEQALNRAQAAEAELKAMRDAAALAEVAKVVDAAIEAGKVAPASRDFYLAACRDEGQRKAFEQLVASAAPIVGPAAEPNKPGAEAQSLTAEEVLVANAMGIAHAEFAKLKGAA